jgi:hypothetical protein
MALMGLVGSRRSGAVVNGLGAVFDVLLRVARLGPDECGLLLRLGLCATCCSTTQGSQVVDARSLPTQLRLLALVVRSCGDGGARRFTPLDAASEAALLNAAWLDVAVSEYPAEARELLCALVVESHSGREKNVYKYLVDRTLEATSGRTLAARYKPFLQCLGAVLALKDSIHLKRVEACLPHLSSRCARLAERKGPGDAEFIYDVSKLTVWLGTHDPLVAASLDRSGGPQMWERWRRSWLFERAAHLR